MEKMKKFSISFILTVISFFLSSTGIAYSGSNHHGVTQKPVSFEKGAKKGWEGTPPGWKRGLKKGWKESTPPIWNKKHEEEEDNGSVEKGWEGTPPGWKRGLKKGWKEPTPPGWNKKHEEEEDNGSVEKGWEGTPPGWKRGLKKGWKEPTPPGWNKKHEEEEDNGSVEEDESGKHQVNAEEMSKGNGEQLHKALKANRRNPQNSRRKALQRKSVRGKILQMNWTK